jgi:hypothetical protein
MAALAFKKFKVEYTNLEGERVKEEPRLMISADGEAKSLVIGQWQVLVEVPYAAIVGAQRPRRLQHLCIGSLFCYLLFAFNVPNETKNQRIDTSK